jgi:enoyl-CoA hydratase/carnithine racemase
MQQNYSGVIRLMRSCPQPIVGLVHGAACGAGFSFLLACDVRFAAPDARMNAAYIRIGVGGCDMGSGYLLPRLVGLSVASEFLLTGRFIKAERAKAIGLVSDITPADELLAKGIAFAEDMLRVSPMGLRMTKQALNTLIDAPSLDAALMIEDRQQVILLETHDHAEAVAAFRERRDPTYSDHCYLASANAAANSRNLNFWILPLAVRGISATISTRSGQNCLAILASPR